MALIPDDWTGEIIGAAIDVHRHLGPGLLESAYEICLAAELESRGVAVQRQLALPVCYKGRRLDAGYRIDLLVEQSVVVELKAVARLEPIHDAELLTYLKLAGLRYGLLLNFNVPVLKHGIRRILNG
ncbi:GxxExxY protein [Thiohalocapsa halophila]|uniref:GxxExxY protein n=1 Tax=Thiohalocapsa halophila TaxID=69359 RepID=A0ABS1CG61_9GAMM|nr:GxxExxY protein [Thiohalocapsa halophila]MBK1630907.1 GxxExxY protein [Thiohalocapsa halophila]